MMEQNAQGFYFIHLFTCGFHSLDFQPYQISPSKKENKLIPIIKLEL